MSRFDICLGFVLEREGGYVDDPSDKGGATNCGITQKVFDEFRSRLGLPSLPVKDISAIDVGRIYRDAYWDKAKCWACPEPLDLVVFDSSVNHGVSRAVKWLQTALGMDSIDGVIGPKTLESIKEDTKDSDGTRALVAHILRMREIFYEGIVARDKSQQKFLNGWLNRLEHLRKAIV